MDFDALVEAQTGLGTAAVIVMNKQVHVCFCWCNSHSQRPQSLRNSRILRESNHNRFYWHLSVKVGTHEGTSPYD